MYRARLEALASPVLLTPRMLRQRGTSVALGVVLIASATSWAQTPPAPVATGGAAQTPPKAAATPAAKPAASAAPAPAPAAASAAQKPAAAAAPTPPPGPCAAGPYRQFDFWLGEWNVVNADGRPLGQSKIESVAGNCGLLENWTSTGGVFSGKSFNSYDRTDRRWHQHWIDAGGGRLVLAGGFAEGKMVLEGAQRDQPKPGDTTTQRITWTPASDGTIRQVWQSSTDGGKNWATVFEGKYIKKDAVSAAPEAAKKEADKKPDVAKKDAPKADAKSAEPKKADAKK